MAARMERTRHPGIYKRGGRYVYVYLVEGKQRKRSAATLAEARELKRARESERDRGEYREQSRLPFREFAEGWIDRYRGNGKRGLTENTRVEYRSDLERYAYPFLAARLGRTVSGITPSDVDAWIAWLCDEGEQGRSLADATVRRIVSPLRACMASAKREGLIAHNPADGAVLPNRPRVDDEEEEVRPFSREQLGMFLDGVHADHRAMFHVLAATGLRWSELAGLRRRDLTLDGSTPTLRVRQAAVERRGKRQLGEPWWRIKPPKSGYGRRDLPLSPELVAELRRHLGDAGEPDDLAFPSSRGTPLASRNVMRRVLKPRAEEVGAPWAGTKTFRHTFASLHIARGTSLLALSRLMGHHSAAFTIRVYGHLIPGDEPAPLALVDELPGGGNEMAMRPTPALSVPVEEPV